MAAGIGIMCSGASAELLRPIDGMDEHPEWISAQAVGIVRGIDHHREDGGPALGRGEARVLVAALDPAHTEAVVGGADHARDLDRNLDLADAGEGIALPGIVVERDRTFVSYEVVSLKPALAHDH